MAGERGAGDRILSAEGAVASPPPLPPRPPRRPRRIVVPILIGIVVFGAGYWYFRHQQMAETPAPSAAAAPALPVTVSKPLIKNIVEWDEFTGQFEAVDSVEIRARVSGYLDTVSFEDGQIVKKGDPLFQIDPRPFQISLSSSQAALVSAKARVDLARQQLTRAEKLRQSDFVSASTYDQRTQELQSAAADAQVATSAINAAQLNLAFSQISAPISGRVGRHEVSIGNLISGGDNGTNTLLTTIVSLDPIRLVFDMPESDFLAYQRATEAGRLESTRASGIKVAARLMDETKWSLEGTLDFVNNQVDRTSGTIRARAVFPNADLFITPGQFGRIRIPGSQPYDAVLIPDAAIISDQSQKIVMTVKPDGTVVPKVIRQGPNVFGLRVVRSGLTADDVIIIDGLVRARPGAKVKPEQGKIEAAATDE